MRNKVKFVILSLLISTYTIAKPPQKNDNTIVGSSINNSTIMQIMGPTNIFIRNPKIEQDILRIKQTQKNQNKNINNVVNSFKDAIDAIKRNQASSQVDLNLNLNLNLSNNNDFPERYYNDGIEYLTNKEYNEAIIFLKKFAELYAKQYPEKNTYYYLGIAYFYNKEYEKAIGEFLKSDTTITETCYYIGRAYDEIGNNIQEYEKAKEWHDTAMKYYNFRLKVTKKIIISVVLKWENHIFITNETTKMP